MTIMHLLNFISSAEFTAFSTIFNLFGNIATLLLTGLTFHLTIFSKKITLLGTTIDTNTFNGTKIALTLKNETLHSISVEDIFIMKHIDNHFVMIDLIKYDLPISIDSWKIEKLYAQPFTSIPNWPVKDIDEYPDYDDLMQNSVLGISSGKHIIWIAPKKRLLREAKKSYYKMNYDTFTVHRFQLDSDVLSPKVYCKITLQIKDLNGQKMLISALGIPVENNALLLNKTILGFNVIERTGYSEKSIKKRIAKLLDISRKDVKVLILCNSFTSSQSE